ncbi:hypothetical protein F383_34815 [Gossypium arboreum]|uniref:Uncharacterized protein n=2 Tax=Gossypium arboreum TaxID=29729 RepID=A0A0B0N4Y0_GOSAR|nr:hypothetical protein F383_34815 [Gossypium arboreum]
MNTNLRVYGMYRDLVILCMCHYDMAKCIGLY